MSSSDSESPPDEVLHHDDRTLRLTVPAFGPELLEKYIQFQEASLAHAESGKADPKRLADAHQVGLGKSGLTNEQAGSIESIVRAFAGTVWSVRHLQRRLQETTERILSGRSPSTASDRALEAKLKTELARIETMSQLASRYGRATIELMQRHEDRLLALHERTGRVFRGESGDLRS